MDASVRNEFLTYKREEIRQRTKYILGFLWAFCVCVLGAYIAIKSRDNEDKLLERIVLFFLFQFLGTTFGLSVCWLASLYNLKFVELYGSTLAGSGFIVMALCIHTDIVDVSTQGFGFKVFIHLFYYMIDAGLLSSNFVPNIFPRVLWLLSAYVLVFTEEVKENKAILPKAVMITTGAGVMEIMFYLQLLTQVKLFLQSRVTKLQCEQLMDILESAPNNVLVCSN